MAYLHCHSCGWSQDDFWEWRWSGLKQFWKWKRRPFGYNPFSLILEYTAEYWKPRVLKFDPYAAKDMGFKSPQIFSWRMLLWNWRRVIRRLFTQKWWTYQSFMKDHKTKKATCPKCKKVDFDID